MEIGNESIQIHRALYKKTAILLVAIVSLGVVFYAVFQRAGMGPGDDAGGGRANDPAFVEKYTKAYLESMSGNRPEALQDLFEEDIKNGVNDAYTKSDAYFITHRYFDNGGNIYEIYNYVNSRPSLAFLQKAELIYPAVFQRIEARSLPDTFTSQGTHAYLAYLQILDEHGYGNAALLGTAANQYAKMAAFVKKAPETYLPVGQKSSQNIQFKLSKSNFFAAKARKEVTDILEGKVELESMPARDIIVGLNQYGSALRFYEYLGFPFDAPKSSREVFAYSRAYAKKHDPDWLTFISLADASTLLFVESSDKEIKNALQPIWKFNTKKTKPPEGKAMDKIIKSRLVPENGDLDMYGKKNTVSLAQRVPEFKAWLISNGWSESDFQ